MPSREGPTACRTGNSAQRLRRLALGLLITAFSPELSFGREAWTIRPEMRLPPVPEALVSALRVVARFDFEKGLEGWRPRHSDVRVEHSRAAARTGRGGLRVRGTEPSNWNFVLSPHMPVEPGRKYRARMWVRVESAPQGARPVYFKIELVYDEKGRSGRVSSTRAPPGLLKEWTRIEAEFEAPPGCRRVWAAVEKGTNSPAAIDVSVDGFVLEEIEEFSRERALRGHLAGPVTKALKGVHPRIYLTAERLETLRAEVRTRPEWAAARKTLFEIADRGLRRGPPDYDRTLERERERGRRGMHEQLWQRGVGNIIPHLALAYLLSGDEKYLGAARDWVFASLSYQTWGLDRIDGMDLAAGHQLTGIGLAYDWLYHDLTPDERAAIRKGVSKRAGAMARAVMTRRVWWQKAYMQNHQWVNCAGLATAGFAMCDEVPEANGWVRIAHEKFLTTLATVGDDGASHEGYGYWEYGVEYIMRYTEMARELLGIDLYGSGKVAHPWLEKGPLYALHLSTPRASWTRRGSVVDIGDCPRYHWYGPTHLLRNLARRYPRSPHAGVAQWLAREIERAGIDSTAGGHYLNFCWYDPRIAQAPPVRLPTLHHFEDIGIVSARSGWDGRESLLVVKCGPPLGHKHVRAPYDYGAGHVHPDAGHFVFFARGQFLVRDEGYSHMKSTADHNTVLIDGRGQKGEGKTWFDLSPWLQDRRAPRIVSAKSTRDADTIVCDVAPAYPPELGLRTFRRTFRFLKPDVLVVQDELKAARPAAFEWRMHLEGAVEKVSEAHCRMMQKGVVLEIGIERPRGAGVSIGERESHKYVALRPGGKRTSVRFEVVLWARPARDKTPWAEKLRAVRARLRSGR